VNSLYDREILYRYFFNFDPVDTAEDSIYIDRITLEETNRVRRGMGLPEIRKNENKNIRDKEPGPRKMSNQAR
jgi:hypothetical protein